ncbi:MAG: sulfatase-like hydrolase/transferase [Chitinophagaceae bacterium]
MKSKAIFFTLLLICSITLFLNAQNPAKKTLWGGSGIKPRNIVLIIADDLGAEQITSYASTLEFASDFHPPALTAVPRMEAAGVRFTQAWSNPTCSPTRAGIHTGQYSCTHGIYSPRDIGTVELEAHPAGNIYTPLPLMMPCNYRKGLFGKWHLGASTDTALPLENGWDYYSGCLAGQLDDFYRWDKTTNGGSISTCTVHATIDLASETQGWIHARCIKGDPFLAVLAFNAPHSTSDKEWHHSDLSVDCVDTSLISHDSEKGIYHGQIKCLDHVVEELIDFMKTNHPAELENTVFIFIGDNGTPDSVGEGVVAGGNAKGTLYQGGVHVPFIIADGYWLTHPSYSPVRPAELPLKFRSSIGAIVKPGSNCDALVHTRDLYATILNLAGVTDPEGGTESKSLVKFMRNPGTAGETYLFTEDTASAYAIRTSKYKLIRYDKSSGTDYEFYDISNNKWDQTTLTISVSDVALRFILEDLKRKLNARICH